ncbi:MAG: carbamoyltransferase HypF [Nitrososphaeria archaeon]|nr:carbamoyltransferase HypF [Nitrososphaeria archaeon]NIN53695.1 carbamoyltransferase HypF [Nitrososphaeria archaeon]NIQ34240.1 carbamoyltransferase HypF [Nitrososphaeria archaeon]
MKAEIWVKGIVQGVGFRPFVYRTAIKNNLVGYVRNMGDAGVEIIVEGEEGDIHRFVRDLKTMNPPLAQIYGLSTRYVKATGRYEKFTILKSSEAVGLLGSVTPPDVSICGECLRELREPGNRRHRYFFITCTDCGPRYTIIERLPYDRPNTTMRDFLMCKDCMKEYTEPGNRRFHAQTTACSKCGPKVYLTTSRGELLTQEDPIGETGRLIEEGYIVAIKGNGGFHVAATTTKDEPIIRLRSTKHRSQKPFAIMSPHLETVKSYAKVSVTEARLLTSYIRPIILLEKSEDYWLSDLLSPGLHNIGVMLPYTALHYMLFNPVKEPAFIMTSANAPSEPIVTENQEAIKKLGPMVDYFLLHDREIAQRCDDSVVRVISENQSLIRRSRGYAPAPIHLMRPVDRCVLGLGAEENVVACVLSGDKAYLSQYIGDIETFETFEYLKAATDHLIKLTNSKTEVVACDLHPQFSTSRLARELGDEINCPVVPIQHHHAHIAALMADCNINEVIGVACDGFGYGLDGNAWGGEIFHCHLEGFRRLGYLEEHPMVGGDLAARFPLRMIAGILYGAVELEEWLLSKAQHLPHGKREVEVILRQIKRGRSVKTTSCGRVLDAVSSLLGVCYERTYEGEPAMKLESAALRGKDILNLRPRMEGKKIDTTHLLLAIFEGLCKHSVKDLACSAQTYLAKALAQLAVEEAKRLGVKAVAFSGGVAHNEHMALIMRRTVESAGLTFLMNIRVPPGDGGISFGQVIIASDYLNGRVVSSDKS